MQLFKQTSVSHSSSHQECCVLQGSSRRWAETRKHDLHSVSATELVFFFFIKPCKPTAFIYSKLKDREKKKKEPYLLPLLNVVLICWAFGVSNGARKEMRAGLVNPLTLPLPLWKISAFPPRLPEVCISSSALFISPVWDRVKFKASSAAGERTQAAGLLECMNHS